MFALCPVPQRHHADVEEWLLRMDSVIQYVAGLENFNCRRTAMQKTNLYHPDVEVQNGYGLAISSSGVSPNLDFGMSLDCYENKQIHIASFPNLVFHLIWKMRFLFVFISFKNFCFNAHLLRKLY